MHVPFNIFQRFFLFSPFPPLIVLSLHLCQPPHAAVVVILFPSAGKRHQVMSSPIKPVLKWVKFQAITRIVRDEGALFNSFCSCHREGDKDMNA